MTAGWKQPLSVWSMYLLSLECKMPVTEEFYPEGNSSTCVIEMRCEMLRKISKGCITTAYTYRFINMFICIFIGTSRSDSACLLFLTLFIVSGSLHLRQ